MATPDTLGSLCDWYKADAITGVAANATVGVGSVVDSSGNSHTFNGASGTSTLRVSGGYLDRNWVEGVGFYNTAGSSPVPTGDATYFGIIKTASSALQGLLGSVGNNGGAYLRLNAFKLQFFGNHVGGGGGSSTINFTSGAWTPFIMTYTKTGGSTYYQVGSSSETVSGTSGTTFTSPGTSRALGLERSSIGNSDGFVGGWVELGRYAAVLSAPDLTLLWEYLTTPVPPRPRVIARAALIRASTY
jgi:hypothetical protein